MSVSINYIYITIKYIYKAIRVFSEVENLF